MKLIKESLETLKEGTTPEQREKQRRKVQGSNKRYTLTLMNQFNYTIEQCIVDPDRKELIFGHFNMGDGKGSYFHNKKEYQRHIDDLKAQGYQVVNALGKGDKVIDARPKDPVDESVNKPESQRKPIRESWDDFDQYEPIVDKYLQPTGEGDTFASQIVTAINKLVYKWFNDGDVYDNTYNLEGWANDLSSYANWLWTYVPDTQEELSRIEDAWDDSDYEDILGDLCHFYLDEETLDEYAQQPKQGTIYDCDGPFAFIYKPYEYDEDDEDGEYEWNKYYSEVNDWHHEHPLG